MKKDFQLLPPSMPNFIMIKQEAKPRQEGFNMNHTVAIPELSKEEANEYADLMRQTFMEHWKRKSSNP